MANEINKRFIVPIPSELSAKIARDERKWTLISIDVVLAIAIDRLILKPLGDRPGN